MQRFLLLVLLVCTAPVTAWGQHAGIFISQEEALAIREAQGQYPLLDEAIALAKGTMETAFANPMEVPNPGEAGGYEHERHKQNYREMRYAGLLYSITGEDKYAAFVRDMLEMYAILYPTLGPHPLAHHQKPGKLFHQTLNEEVWLVHTSIAYDCVYDWLSEEERTRFESNIFRPMADWFLVRNKAEFDRIHNHGTWAVAAVGMIAYVLGDLSLVEKSLHGSDLDGKGGFLAQLDLLFSPDGYYMEGPYYIRYALMPFFYFAEAVERMQPEVGIYEYRDQILKKAYYSAVQTSFPDGVFPPINDASLTMDVAAPEVILANSLAYDRYGMDEDLQGVAKVQGRVSLNGSGLALARDFESSESDPLIAWPSVEFSDGSDGLSGGLGILRMGQDTDQSMLLMKYGVHGGGHGHFDKLHFIFFDQDRQVIRDYGFGRWINVEPKFGGRYLPENNSYAMQTVAHNTVVVDGVSQNMGDEDAAESMSAKRHFFESENPPAIAMSAHADTYYDGVDMQRTMLLVNDETLPYPVVVDLFRLRSDVVHQYDYPLHYSGQYITSNLQLETNTDALEPLGDDHGYQHIWQTAHAQRDSTIQYTWLDGNRYYSLISSAWPGTEVYLGRTGANDPNFNLQSHPLLILRRQADTHLFASVIEPHGYFNEARERSVQARPRITGVEVVGHSDVASVIRINGQDGLHWQIIVSNLSEEITEQQEVVFGDQSFQWTGRYHVDFQNNQEAN
ncbi:MAG: alginate lyase family protein [Rhodothermaceae bacterium]|nr:alginate lyase family protein [Rhodothermaceae bacterium]MYE62760.1 alginate lyase family protein [Rhodothermaceae bacterium]MYJ20887.1 alginate lyase family protein [Rhodothermaceae bacterium]